MARSGEARPPPRRQADAASTWKALQWVLDAGEPPQHGDALAGHPGLWRGRGSPADGKVTRPIRKVHQASLGDQGLSSRTLVATKLFLFPLASGFYFPLLCPEGSGVATGARGSGRGRLLPPACTPPAPFRRISPCAQREEARAGPSPGHTALPAWTLMAKSPSCFLWCIPGRPCLAWMPRPPDSVGHPWEALWWQPGLHFVRLPPSLDEPGSVWEGGVSFISWSGSKGQ